MRVLMICPELPKSGDPGSMAPASRQFESLRRLGIDLEVVDMSGIPKLKYLTAMPCIRRLSRRVDVVHAHFGYCGWLARIANFASLRQTPFIMSFMGDDLLGTPLDEAGKIDRFSRWMVTANCRLAHKADRVIVKSQEMAGVLAPLVCDVIPNGVDLETFCPQDRFASRSDIALHTDRPLVLFPGNPENPRKGYGFAKRAVQRAAELIGSPIDVVPLWNIAPDDVAKYMNACDVMAMCSLIEGSPNVVKEAMACNLPVVSVPVGDSHELLEDVECCYCVTRDEELFAQALAEALQSGRRSSGRNALQHRGLDLHSVARRIESLYHTVLERSKAPGSLQPGKLDAHASQGGRG